MVSSAPLTSENRTGMRSIGPEVCRLNLVHDMDSHSREDVINSVCYSTYSGGPVSLDQGQVKVVSLAPVMLNKGHTLLDPDGPVWVCGGAFGCVIQHIDNMHN